MRKIVGISRAEEFSPNSVERDREILLSVADELKSVGYAIDIYGEDEQIPAADGYFTMGRRRETISFLMGREGAGAFVVNSAFGIDRCRRSELSAIMKMNNIPMPDEKGADGYWIKRGDAAAQSADDVLYAKDDNELSKFKEQFLKRGINSFVVSAHVKGDLVKFYGVRGTDFFRYYYPNDDGLFKFADETHNGTPHHYKFSERRLRYEADRLSAIIELPVYGGDCIVDAGGDFKIIDFNDWPSFSRCRDEAAKAIAGLIKNRYGF